ncbi:MAG TPA: Fe2+-dependent dioxygenase [Crinalium sp.]|jgi:PKHD-type hydroxylase
MIFTIENILTENELTLISEQIHLSDFIDGKQTAGWHAQQVKHNTQLSSKASYAQPLKEMVSSAIRRHPLFQSAVQPKAIHTLLFSRYESGMSYGTHVDNALMGQQFRSDVSFTLFLSPPDEYEGGELVIEASDGDRAFKLEKNAMLVYPSSYLHRVAEVTKGVRFVCVGWVQSLVRDPAKREILFDLDTVKRSLFTQQGKTLEFDLLSKSHSNLLRQWCE